LFHQKKNSVQKNTKFIDEHCVTQFWCLACNIFIKYDKTGRIEENWNDKDDKELFEELLDMHKEKIGK